VVGAALALRVAWIGAQELWLDEVLSVAKATNPAWLGAPALRANTPPLYYVLLRAWVALVGTSETAVRLPSAVLGAGFVAAILWTAHEVFGRRVAVWAGLVAAVNPIHVYYSQEARAYALLTLALLLAMVTLWRALRDDTTGAWALFAGAALASLYSHYSAVLGLLPGSYLVWAWPGPPAPGRRWRRYGAALGVAGALFLPWVVGKVLLSRGAGADWWVPELWARTPPALALLRSLEVFGLGPEAGLLPIALKQYTVLAYPTLLRVLGLAGLLGAALWLAAPRGAAGLGIAGLGIRKAWLALALAGPLVLPWLVSVLGRPVYLAGRYDQVAFPPVPLLLGLALAKAYAVPRRGPVWAGALALALLGPAAIKLALYYEAPGGGPARAAAAAIDARVNTGDVAILTGSRGLQIAYALTRLGYERAGGVCRKGAGARWFGCPLFPAGREAVFAPGQPEGPSGQRTVREEVGDLVARAATRRGAVWAVFESGAFLVQDGRLLVPDPEAGLVRELERLGLRPAAVPGAPGLFRFAPPAGGGRFAAPRAERTTP
jgi:hypothetical protein